MKKCLNCLLLLLFTTSCTTKLPEFSVSKSGFNSFYARDDISYFLGIAPEGPVTGIIVKSCSISYTMNEIVVNVQSTINFFQENGIPESDYPEGFIFIRISDPCNRKVFVQVDDLEKKEILFVGAMQFPSRCEYVPDEVFQ